MSVQSGRYVLVIDATRAGVAQRRIAHDLTPPLVCRSLHCAVVALSRQRQNEAGCNEQPGRDPVDAQRGRALPAAGEYDQRVRDWCDRRGDQRPAECRAPGGRQDHEQHHPGGDVASALDLGQGTQVVRGDAEGERRLTRLQEEADADRDDGDTREERDQEGGELHGTRALSQFVLALLYNDDILSPMSPRPAPDLNLRRDQIAEVARGLAESDGWPAVTMRRLAGELGVTQPVLYSAFDGRQALIDAVVLSGFSDLAAALKAVDASPMARMRAYLDFAEAHPRVYEAMFSLPSGLAFAADDTPAPLRLAFSGIYEAFPDDDGTRAEVAWSVLHGLATLQASRRLRANQVEARLDLAHRMLTQSGSR